MKKFTDKTIEKLWLALTDIPFDGIRDDGTLEGEDMYLSKDYANFLKGTPRNDIWKWFDSNYSDGLFNLMNLANKGG